MPLPTNSADLLGLAGLHISPHLLKEMMRHDDIRTTLDYYIDLDANELGKAMYEAYAKMKSSPENVLNAEENSTKEKMAVRILREKQRNRIDAGELQ